MVYRYVPGCVYYASSSGRTGLPQQICEAGDHLWQRSHTSWHTANNEGMFKPFR